MNKLFEIIEKPLSGEWGNDGEAGKGIPVLRTTNFTNDGVIDYSNVVTRTIDAKKVKEKYLRSGDIIIEKSGGSPAQPVGRVVLFEGEDNKYLFNNFTSVLRLRDKNVNSPKYLFYHLFSYYKMGVTRKFQNKTTGISNLKLDRFIKETEITLPPLEEQSEIAKTLDTAAELLAMRKQQLAELDNLIKSIFYDMFGNPVTNDKGWEVRKLGDLFNITSGGTPSTSINSYWGNGNISWIGSNLCQNEILYGNDGKFITQLGLDNSSAKLFSKGTVLVALVGATIGKTALLRFQSSTNQNVAGIEVHKNEDFTSEYVYYAVQSKYYKFLELANGNFKMANLGFIRNLDIYVPPLPFQTQFASIVTKIEEQKTLVKKAIDETQYLFDSLMSEYFE